MQRIYYPTPRGLAGHIPDTFWSVPYRAWHPLASWWLECPKSRLTCVITGEKRSAVGDLLLNPSPQSLVLGPQQSNRKRPSRPMNAQKTVSSFKFQRQKQRLSG